jgi:NAD(P)-dependent dehydrogenase (short-subunit alcohol dehydrogenase family)
MSEFSNQSVIVTGGSKGIGRAVCLAFAGEGAEVLCVDVDEDSGQALAEAHSGIRFFRADVSKSEDCRNAVEAVAGKVDVLCNNAGIQPMDSYARADELPEEVWDRVIDVNLKGVFLMSCAVIPAMKATEGSGGGAIINIASVQGLQSMKRVSAYAASKGGVLSLTRQLALDFAEDGIRVLAVNPGTIETPLVEEAAAAHQLTMVDARKKGGEAHPIGRIGQPGEIAEVVLFLSSQRAGFMTGEFVNVDGGLMAKGSWA